MTSKTEAGLVEAHVDTSRQRIIPAKPCTVYDWLIGPDENGETKLRSISHRYIGSLHELTCQWAAMKHDLSLDSTQLPRYVETMSDTLRLSTNATAFAVQFRPSGNEDVPYQKNLFLVANVADSLYYRRLKTVYTSFDQRSSLSVRGLRTLEVPGATQTYIWVEVEDRSVARETVSQDSLPASEYRQWFGYVFAYDRIRGLRYLLDGVVPIRVEDIRAGETVGVMQWDVSIPEPGIMEVVPRTHWGQDLPPRPRGWLGAHVIDSSAVADTSAYRYLLDRKSTCC